MKYNFQYFGPGLAGLTVTFFFQVTKTHTLRIPSTSDVWVTSVRAVTVPVTQLTTVRSYRSSAQAETVTSFLRITKTEVKPETVTVEVFPTRTAVSVFTSFVTDTTVVDLWQPIVHLQTKFEVSIFIVVFLNFTVFGAFVNE